MKTRSVLPILGTRSRNPGAARRPCRGRAGLAYLAAAAFLSVTVSPAWAQDEPSSRRPRDPSLILELPEATAPPAGPEASPPPTGSEAGSEAGSEESTVSGETATGGARRPWPDNQRARRVRLRYRETARSGPTVTRGEGLTGGVGYVTESMEAAGAATTGEARLQVLIRPRVERQENSRWRISLDVARPDLQIDATIAADNRRIVRQEAREVVRRLQDWSKELDETEERRLYTSNILPVDLDQPFAHLVLLPKPDVVLQVRGASANIPRLRWVSLVEGKYRPVSGQLKLDEVYFLEALFVRPPPERRATAKVSWGTDEFYDVDLERTGDRPRLYRSGRVLLFVPDRRSDGR